MGSFKNRNFFRTIIRNLPIILLFISVLNEFDFNYLGLTYFSFDFPFILIFYWSLKKNESLGYGFIFIAGMINDVVIGLPIGISSLSYLFVCVFASYLRNITLRPNLIKDWIYFLVTLLILNSLSYISLAFIFEYDINFIDSMISTSSTFFFYIIFVSFKKNSLFVSAGINVFATA